MKVIGAMGGTLTVQMDIAEFGSITDLNCDQSQVLINGRWHPWSYVGEVNVRAGWRQLHLLRQNRDELKKAQRQLRAIADVLEPLEMVVAQELPPDKPVESDDEE